MENETWGFMELDAFGVKQFVELPRLPMTRAGLGPPPFTVTLPMGQTRDVVLQSQVDELTASEI